MELSVSENLWEDTLWEMSTSVFPKGLLYEKNGTKFRGPFDKNNIPLIARWKFGRVNLSLTWF